MSGAPTGPGAHSIRRPTACTFIRTRPLLHCAMFPPNSPRVELKPRGAFCAPPPNLEKTKKQGAGEGAPGGDAAPDLEGPEDWAESAGGAGRREDADPEVRAAGDRAGAHSSVSACKGCRWSNLRTTELPLMT